MTVLIIVLVLILAIVLTVAGIIIYLKAKLNKVERQIIRKVNHAVRGADCDEIKSFMEGVFEDTSNTPKSISGMTSIYLPMIARDYPDLNYDEMKRMAKSFLTSYFNSITLGNIDVLEYADDDFKKKVSYIIADNSRFNTEEHYEKVKIHQLELRNYTNAPGKHIISFQASVEYYHYKKKSGQITEGSKEQKCQMRYNIDMLHIQDRNLFDGTDISYGYNCPNCGAPLKAEGKIVCKYCGTGIEDFNIKVWAFTDIKEA